MIGTSSMVGNSGSANKPSHVSAFNYYEDGEYETAFRMFLEMAENGDVECQSIVGKMFLAGEGTAANQEEAYFWFDRAALNHHVDAFVGLAAIADIRGDRNDAYQRIKAAANGGNITGRYRLAVMYETGYLGKPDMVKAVREYRRAADDWHLLAKTRLGLLAMTNCVP